MAATRDDRSLAGVFGTMGGDAQPQIMLQLATRLLHHRQTPARAIGAGRWALTGETSGFDTWTSGERPGVSIEGHAPTGVGDRAGRTRAPDRRCARVGLRLRSRLCDRVGP